METITKRDSRIVSFFDSLNRVSNSLECLLKEHKPMFNGERYITDEELSLRLKIHRRSLNDYRKNGILAYINWGGKTLYKESDIQKLLENNYYAAWNERALGK